MKFYSCNIFEIILIKINVLYIIFSKNKNMGIGDWGWGIGDWGLGPIPNPQSPIPNPHIIEIIKYIFTKFNI